VSRIKCLKFLSPVLFAFFLASIPSPAAAQTYKVLHTFTGAPKDGQWPVGALARDAVGNLYGATREGGPGTCANGQFSCGTVFMLTKTGKEVGVFSFTGQDGDAPGAGLFRDSAGNLYGTTTFGGPHSCGPDEGCGTLFQLNSRGSKIRYYSFDGQNGEFPESPLIEFSGSLYGTTPDGGALGLGTVYKINTVGKETVLHSFEDGADGCDPSPGVTADSKGNLYGVTVLGGSGGSCNDGDGTAYELDTAGNFIPLITFGGEGSYPDSPLIFDPQGNLYGVAGAGGSSNGCSGGCGTLYELSPNNGTWSGRRVYSFCSLPNCADGSEPGGSIVRDNNTGNIYGITVFGGAYGYGTVFKLDANGNETVLYSFMGGSDGANPEGGLAMDASGNLYGVTPVGGDISCDISLGGCGVVFELTP
jgi:uncharacterized repeat protein (TIGR03803 family)